MRVLNKISQKSSRILAAVVLMTAQISPFFVMAPKASATNNDVTICHRTNSATNPYVELTVNKNAVDGVAGNSGATPDHYGEHQGPLAVSVAAAKALKDAKTEWGDIIPAVSPYHGGSNWTAEGQEILRNDCDLREPTSVIVKKVLVPSNDPGRFDLNVTKSGSDEVFDNAGNGDASSKTAISHSADLVVYEEPGTANDDLNDYTTFIECTNLDGETLASGSRTGSSSRSMTVDKSDIDEGDQITCVFTNTKIVHTGKVEVDKKVDADGNGYYEGGNTTANGLGFRWGLDSEPVDNNMGDMQSDITTGNHTVTENTVSGYEFKGWYYTDEYDDEGQHQENCNYPRGTTLPVNISVEKNKTTEITLCNKKIPNGSVKVIKDVVNDNGGTRTYENFTFKLSENDTPRTFSQSVDEDGETVVSLPADTQFDVVEIEANQNGYTTTYTGECSGTVKSNETKVCTITNDDNAPKLTLRKNVITDNGGNKHADDWTLKAKFGNSYLINQKGSPANQPVATTQTVDAKAGVSYELNEYGPSGYEASDWSCTGGNGNELQGNVVTLELGENVLCEITNDDLQGSLTLYKNVINDNGGKLEASDFVLTIHDAYGNLVDYQASGVAIMLDAGLYNVGEQQQEGYVTYGWDWYKGDCSLTGWVLVQNGGTYECTITNDDLPGKIVVHKEVVNNNGGDKKAKDFRFKVDHNGQWENFNYNPLNHYESTNYVLVDAGWHSVYEDEHYAYRTEYEGCKHIYVKNGEVKHCYITNNDKAPEVKVVKMTDPHWSDQNFDFVMKSNGKYYSSFTLNTHPYDQTPNHYETGYSLKEGWVYIYEKEVEGWDNIWIKCFKEGRHGLEYVGHPFKAEVGKEYVCKVFNKQRGSVVVTKFNDQNQNGYMDEGEDALPEWTMTLSGEDKCEIEVGDNVAEALLSYNEQESDCDDSSVNLSEITDENGQATFGNLHSGKYVVGEELKDGWVQTGIYCDYGREEQPELTFNRQFTTDDEIKEEGSLYLHSGATVYCYVGNYQTPAIDVVAESVCINDFPYLRWNVTPTNIVPTQFTIEWFTLAGNQAGDPAGLLVDTQVFALADTTYDAVTNTYSATTLWPGSNDDPNNLDWPGWRLENGLWVEDPADFGGNLRPNAAFSITVNPTDSGTTEYPPSLPDCDPNPSNPQVLGTSTLADTGSNAYANIMVGLLLIGAVGALQFASKKSKQ